MNTNTALEEIRVEMEGVNMGKSIMRTVEIPEENLDIFDKFVQLAKGKIISHISSQKKDDDITASHKEFFSKYVGIVKGSTTDEEANEFRAKRYAK